jgi:hypothetical protein
MTGFSPHPEELARASVSKDEAENWAPGASSFSERYEASSGDGACLSGVERLFQNRILGVEQECLGFDDATCRMHHRVGGDLLAARYRRARHEVGLWAELVQQFGRDLIIQQLFGFSIGRSRAE